MNQNVINNWKDTQYFWIRKNNTCKISMLPNTICIFNAISNKIPMAFFTEVGQIILKLLWKYTQKNPK